MPVPSARPRTSCEESALSEAKCAWFLPSWSSRVICRMWAPFPMHAARLALSVLFTDTHIAVKADDALGRIQTLTSSMLGVFRELQHG